MSVMLLRRFGGGLRARRVPQFQPALMYSRRSASKDHDPYKPVKRREASVEQDDPELLGCECGPNWEILAPRGNRFYFPNAIGPAWQNSATMLDLDEPLETLVDFNQSAYHVDKLQFSVVACPSLIKNSLHELFPSPEVLANDKMALMTLRYDGDIEQGARKFVLAASEITSRLRVQGYWADFMNPFSGKPFHSWSGRRNLYKVDDRFRGLNMKLDKLADCVIIGVEDVDKSFAGAIYSNAPTNYKELRLIIDIKD